MEKFDASVAEQVARAALACERQRTGHAPDSVAVALGADTLVVTLYGALSPAERALAHSPPGADRVQEPHRQPPDSASESLRREIGRITGVEVREAAAAVEPRTGTVMRAFTTGTVVQMHLLASVPPGTWRGRGEQP